MRPSQREETLDAALRVVNEQGADITFESVSKAAGMTKAGLMYHFATKEQLMTALVEHVIARWKAEMAAELGRPVEDSTPRERVQAFLQFAVGGGAEMADFVVFAESIRNPVIAKPWLEYLRTWFDFDTESDVDLLVPWLAANGAWIVEATGVVALTPEQRSHLIATLQTLIEGRSA
ncbi:TetR family transcriptional regulator [Antribacter sp. KLBMP9083]|uniref:TetR family transcriptional regulator n=1 Tax=Antribacter soli TaxID=2910976 RepID=A0AA41QFN5_9MICO|nr:TetR family transcriptional regulator [Antribacter soli]MCF4122598.1 TetR family transcriptional regulator [Antribacter soli]